MKLTYVIVSSDHGLKLELEEKFLDFPMTLENVSNFSSKNLQDVLLDAEPDFIFINLDNSGIKDLFLNINEWMQFLNKRPALVAISKKKNMPIRL